MRNARFLQVLFAIFSANAVLAAEKPNIIFILSDNLGYGDLRCYGQKLIRTRNIDKLAKQGMRFTQCWIDEGGNSDPGLRVYGWRPRNLDIKRTQNDFRDRYPMVPELSGYGPCGFY